jgi:hypothetical protein
LNTLGKRLGLTTHISLLDRKVRALFNGYPSNTAAVAEDWLLDVANARGARVVRRDNPPDGSFTSPSKDKLYRLSDMDLLLSKLMRYDPTDLKGAIPFVQKLAESTGALRLSNIPPPEPEV